jgi:hypothetical protein
VRTAFTNNGTTNVTGGTLGFYGPTSNNGTFAVNDHALKAYGSYTTGSHGTTDVTFDGHGTGSVIAPRGAHLGGNLNITVANDDNFVGSSVSVTVVSTSAASNTQHVTTAGVHGQSVTNDANGTKLTLNNHDHSGGGDDDHEVAS